MLDVCTSNIHLVYLSLCWLFQLAENMFCFFKRRKMFREMYTENGEKAKIQFRVTDVFQRFINCIKENKKQKKKKCCCCCEYEKQAAEYRKHINIPFSALHSELFTLSPYIFLTHPFTVLFSPFHLSHVIFIVHWLWYISHHSPFLSYFHYSISSSNNNNNNKTSTINVDNNIYYNWCAHHISFKQFTWE